MKNQPPRLARKLLEWTSSPAAIDDLLGDLDELFYHNLKTGSAFRARRIYWQRVLSLIFSYAIKTRKRAARTSHYAGSTVSLDMLQNYFKVAIRNLSQYKYFSILNAFGLAIGMSISLLLIALLSYVNTYDDFQVKRENIYTITSNRTEGVEQLAWATAPFILAEKIKQHPDVQEVVRIHSRFREEVRKTQGLVPISGYYVEPNFLKTFTYEITQGNVDATLTKPDHLIVTESAAIKLFNTTEVLGKNLELKDGRLMEIGAVMKDHPINSHLKFDVLASFVTLPAQQVSVADQWMHFNYEYVYVLLNKNSDPAVFQQYLDQVAASTYAQLPIKVKFETQHINDIPLGPDLRMAIGPKWEASGMIVFAIIAVLILLPACFNYTNISIARALKRAKEIGLRKTMGGVKNQIFFQFITETVVITLISLVGALLIFFLIRPEFQNSLVAASSLDLSLTPHMLFWFLVFALGTGFVAGVFPALYFGGLNPIQALKNKAHAGSSGMRVRKVLTVFQFALSFGFILSLVVFSRQYQYSLNFNFGFAKENIVDLQLQGVNPQLVKNEFSAQTSVQSMAMSSQRMGLDYTSTWVKNNKQDSTEVAQMFVDHNYLPLFGLTLLAGNNFPEETWQREKFIIVNEEFLKNYSVQNPADALGKTYQVEGNELEVIGVVKNFHFTTLRYPIGKFFFRMNPDRYAYAHLKVNTTDAFTLFTDLENRWKNLDPEQKMQARFFEDELNEGYESYVTLLKIVGFLGLLAITISLLGLLGMVVYTAETKVKEVSIRKVLGASLVNLNVLLSKEYLKLMLWAIFISAPITAYLFQLVLPKMQHYSVSLTGWDVLFSTVLLLGLGVITITSQTYKTAQANPAETLRSE